MKIATRAELDSRPFRTPPTHVPLSQRRYFVVHYPGAGTPPKDLKSMRKWIERIHMDQNGWRGVGYNFIVDAYGNVGEGAGRDVMGSHSPPRNRDGIGVMLWTSNGKSTEATKKAARELYDRLCKEAGRTLTISWHGQHYATACPGPELTAWAKSGMPVGQDTVVTPKPDPKPKPTPSKWDGKSFPGAGAFQIGKSHPAVTVLGERLIKHGFGKRYKVGPGDKFTEVDRLSTQDFQLAQGYKGTQKGGGADGFPGPQTWAALMKDPAKKSSASKPKPKKKPEVSLSAIISAAKKDTARPQGGTTPGSADDVKIVEEALRKEGLLSAKYASDGSFGASSVTAYSKWQRKCGAVGKGADGIPGKETLTKLGKKYGFTVVK